jgi:peptide-methionine (S)-S-oxide reductase
MSQARDYAILGGGCFWCLEAVFEQVIGVESVVSGYSGGKTENPNYEEVCTGSTGHAEVVRVVFDPEVISYAQLLEIFFVIHDPTTKNRQGDDVGTQYRSVVFYHSDAQKSAASSVMQTLAARGLWDAPPVTEILPEAPFYAAEDYHQHYFARNPHQGYCQMVVAPKVAKFRKKFSSRLKAST